MYLHASHPLGQVELPSRSGTLCTQDDVKGRIEAALLSDNVSKTLDDFNFRDPGLRTWHRTWIKRQFVPAIVASFKTNKPIRTVILIGDADEIGEPGPNYKLGKARAESVRAELKKELKGLATKVTIEVFSRGECWPIIQGGKREGRNRRVEVFGVRDTPAATTTQPPPSPGPTPTKKPPNLRDIPDKIKKELEEKDRRELELRRFDPIPKLPPGKSLRQWLEEHMSFLPKIIRGPIVDAIVSGACAGLGALLDQAGLGNAEKEGLKAMCKAVAQSKTR